MAYNVNEFKSEFGAGDPLQYNFTGVDLKRSLSH